ncbi:unnamed protein product [Lathyrus oleraceus]
MESNNPYEILDDDDGFDWEAAAREIDTVFQTRSDANKEEKVCEKGEGKQSTLDNFLGIGKNETEAIQVQENDAEESICSHHIDTEAAKTWIYPVNVPL